MRLSQEPYTPPHDLIGADAARLAERMVAIAEAAGETTTRLRLLVEIASWAFKGE